MSRDTEDSLLCLSKTPTKYQFRLFYLILSKMLVNILLIYEMYFRTSEIQLDYRPVCKM